MGVHSEAGSGEDRDMSGDALTAWQRDKWKQLLAVEDTWRTGAGVTVVGEEGVATAQCALSPLYLRCRTSAEHAQKRGGFSAGVDRASGRC